MDFTVIAVPQPDLKFNNYWFFTIIRSKEKEDELK